MAVLSTLTLLLHSGPTEVRLRASFLLVSANLQDATIRSTAQTQVRNRSNSCEPTTRYSALPVAAVWSFDFHDVRATPQRQSSRECSDLLSSETESRPTTPYKVL